MLFELSVFALCLFYLFHALRLPFGELAETGPGFFPAILGVCGLTITGVLLINSFLETRGLPLGRRLFHGHDIDLTGNRVLFIYILAMIAFVMVFDLLGGIVAIFLLTFGLSKICGLKGWWRPALLGTITTACLYVIFGIAFRINLPSGILGFIL